MINKRLYFTLLKKEIIQDPTNQGYNQIFRAEYENPEDKYTKIAERINLNRAAVLDFPIVRTNIVQFVLKDE